MPSKEEIEEGKAHLCWLLDNGIFTSEDEPHIEAVLEYIEQLEQEKVDRINADNYENSYIAKLESDKQKLIEKLEEDIRELEALNDNYTDADIFEGIYTTRGQIIKAKEILSILKGE